MNGRGRAFYDRVKKLLRGFEGVGNLLASEISVNKIQLADLARGWPKLLKGLCRRSRSAEFYDSITNSNYLCVNSACSAPRRFTCLFVFLLPPRRREIGRASCRE